jgi:preprotein translocase subunit SecF
MEFFKIKKDIPFMRYAFLWNTISLVTFLLAIFFLVSKGLNFSIEFTGGAVLELKYQQPPNLDSIRDKLNTVGVHDAQVLQFGSSRDVLVRFPIKDGVDAKQVQQKVESTLREVSSDVTIARSDFIGGQVGNELARDGALALLFVAVGIMIYLALRFEWKFAVSGIIANLHDVVIILGFFAFFQWEFSLSVLAGLLAVLGYSVNESVIIFDRIRESFKTFTKASTVEVINNAITRTISRTVITHGSTQMMVLAMLLLGGPTLHYFAVALTIGILFGIYSSVFVAASLVMWFGVKREDLVKKDKKTRASLSDPHSGAQV